MIQEKLKFEQKNVKIIKWAHAFKCYASSYNEILNSFNPKLQLKETESVIKNMQ